MERRGFFQSIAGLFVVGAVFPAVSTWKTGVDQVAESAQSKLERLTRYMHEELRSQIGGRWPMVPEHPHLVYAHQANAECAGIDMILNAEELENLPDETIRQRYVVPAMRVLGQQIREKGARQFYRLDIPGGVDSGCLVTEKGISLRGLRAFDLRENRWVTRFDVLFSA